MIILLRPTHLAVQVSGVDRRIVHGVYRRLRRDGTARRDAREITLQVVLAIPGVSLTNVGVVQR